MRHRYNIHTVGGHRKAKGGRGRMGRERKHTEDNTCRTTMHDSYIDRCLPVSPSGTLVVAHLRTLHKGMAIGEQPPQARPGRAGLSQHTVRVAVEIRDVELPHDTPLGAGVHEDKFGHEFDVVALVRKGGLVEGKLVV